MPPKPRSRTIARQAGRSPGLSRYSPNRVGGGITVALGGLELDLRECRMAEATAELIITVNMKNLEIEIPKAWAVESQLRTALGDFEDRARRPIDPAAKRLILRGYVFLGNIEVRN